MTAPTLSITDLDIGFAITHNVVHSVNLEVRPAEIVALVGESGSGKSLTAKAVLGLLPNAARASGSVQLCGRQMLGADEPTLRASRGTHVAMVFQEPATALNPVQTIGWQITEALRSHRRMKRRTARTRAVELLRLVEIPEPEQRLDAYPHQLSGGQKQRVVIALALANEPDLIIADEPTTALDVTVQAEILRLLGDLRDRLGRAILLITHNMGVVAELADRVVVLRAGRVVESGPVGQIFTDPTARYTQELLAAVPRIKPEAEPEPATAGGDQPVLGFTNLTVEFATHHGRQRFTAISDLSLTLNAGNVLGLVGESGSGKSTLGKAAIALVRPKSGTATVLGKNLAGITTTEIRSLRRRIGVVFQDPGGSLDPRRSIHDAIAEPLHIHRPNDQIGARVDELLDAVHLPRHFAGRRPAELSGGQRQRVGLARALALDPELVIADEPTSALDVTVQAAVLDLVRELQQRLGFACLFISHDLAVVDEIADDIAVLQAGRLVESGPPAIVLRTPASDYTQQLLAAVPDPYVRSERARYSRPA